MTVAGGIEGIVPAHDFVDGAEVPGPGSEIDVAVVKLQHDGGPTVLSKKRADYEGAWERILRAMETGETIRGTIAGPADEGVEVDVGIRGLVPASQMAADDLRALDRLVGHSLPLKVIGADRERKLLVLSHLAAAAEVDQDCSGDRVE